MAEFSATSHRADPYKNFLFRIGHNKTTVLGVSKLSGFKRTTEVVKHRAGGDPTSSRKSPGRTEYEALVAERGVTHDPWFEQWANKVWNHGAGPGSMVSLADYKRDLRVEVCNEAGQVVIAYDVFNCWVSEYEPMGELDANSNGILIAKIKIENEGWRRDPSVVEPTPPSFTRPNA